MEKLHKKVWEYSSSIPILGHCLCGEEVKSTLDDVQIRVVESPPLNSGCVGVAICPECRGTIFIPKVALKNQLECFEKLSEDLRKILDEMESFQKKEVS